MRGSSKQAGTTSAEKPISPYPLTLEEAVDKLLKFPPPHSRGKKPASPKPIAVALLFAGGDQGGANGKGLTYANPVQPVLQALGIALLP